jgi:Icc-related predicted phosphoesterase
MIRVAAVGDVHLGTEMRGTLRASFANVSRHADMLLLAGDLTQHGASEEGRLLADELSEIEVPIVAVLGNHDYHRDAQKGIRSDLESVGVTVLEGESTILQVGQARVGIAGVKGFGGGFAGACGSEFGEPEMKGFIRHTKGKARELGDCLKQMQCEIKIALLHYAPAKDTLMGEKLEIYPFLGSYLLGEAIDEAGCDLAIHGHAHRGVERGITPGGIAVRNVARPVVHVAYQLYCLLSRATRARQGSLPLDYHLPV